MLQRGLPAVLQWAPALSSAGCHLQQAAQQITSVCSTSGNSNVNKTYSLSTCFQQRRGFKAGVVDVRGQSRRRRSPYFNPDDGPEAYDYWKDLWRHPGHSPQPKRPKRLPVYLEPEEQQALLTAAQQAGVPVELTLGDMSVRQVPRLIAAVQACGGRIPTDPGQLSARILELRELERQVPGLDVMRIFKANGFGILASSPKRVLHQLAYLSRKLSATGVAAEPGLLLTAAVKPAIKYPIGLVNRAQALPDVWASVLGCPAPSGLLQQPFAASVLNRTSKAAEKHMRAMAVRHGKPAAAEMYRRLPQLLLYRTALLRRKTRRLAEGLGLSLSAAERLVRQNPRLLTQSADAVAEKIEGLRSLLGLKTLKAVRSVVLTQPSLLHKKTETIAGKMETIQEQLGLATSSEAAKLLRGMPFLASYSQTFLQQPLQQLNSIPDGSLFAPLKAKAVEVLRAKPWLLTLGSSVGNEPHNSITGRLQLLEKVAGMGDSWQGLVQQFVEGSSEDVAAVLADEGFVERMEWLLQLKPQQAPPAAEGVGVYGLVVMREARFDKRYPGFRAQKEEQLAARAAARKAAQQAAAGGDDT